MRYASIWTGLVVFSFIFYYLYYLIWFMVQDFCALVTNIKSSQAALPLLVPLGGAPDELLFTK